MPMRESMRETTSFAGIISEVVTDGTNTSEVQESSFTDESDVFFHKEILV